MAKVSRSRWMEVDCLREELKRVFMADEFAPGTLPVSV